jgi:hypothetical protein
MSFSKTLIKENNQPKGENSPNMVTLDENASGLLSPG